MTTTTKRTAREIAGFYGVSFELHGETMRTENMGAASAARLAEYLRDEGYRATVGGAELLSIEQIDARALLAVDADRRRTWGGVRSHVAGGGFAWIGADGFVNTAWTAPSAFVVLVDMTESQIAAHFGFTWIPAKGAPCSGSPAMSNEVAEDALEVLRAYGFEGSTAAAWENWHDRTRSTTHSHVSIYY